MRTSWRTYDKNKTRFSQMTDEDKMIWELIFAYVNEPFSHRINKDKLIDEVEEIVDHIADIAMRIDDGAFELPQEEGNE